MNRTVSRALCNTCTLDMYFNQGKVMKMAKVYQQQPLQGGIV